MPLLCALLIMVIAMGVAARAKGWLRWISGSVMAILFLAIVALGLLFAAMEMELGGIWPFDPLASYHKERPLDNGGTLVFDEKESRGFGKGSSYTDSIGYLPSDSNHVEPMASETRESWGAWNWEEVKVYFSGDLVVVVSPGASDFFVRSPPSSQKVPASSLTIPEEGAAILSRPSAPSSQRDGCWRRLSLHYPHGDEVSTAIYSTFIGHPEEVLLKTRADIVANEKHEPSVQIAYFHPAIRELAVSFDAGKTVSHQVLLDLSEDGTRLGPHQFMQLPALATGDR